jgi:hypothetical protein
MPWREDSRKSENEHDLSQVEAPTEEGKLSERLLAEDNTPILLEEA